MRILLLSPYAPYPPHGGGTMRIYQILRGLAARHTVTCLSFVGAAPGSLAPLQRHARIVEVNGPAARSLKQRGLTTLFSSMPDMALRNADPAYTQALRRLLLEQSFDLVQAESIEMAPYLLAIARFLPRPQRPMLVLDQFNAEYLLQKRAALTSLAAVPRRQPLHSLVRNLAGGSYSLVQWGKLARFEQHAMRWCDAVVAVSDDDAQILQQLAPNTRIGVVPNGVDTSEFDRTMLGELEVPSVPTIVFSGTLDFRPNIDAATWFCEAVWPLVRAQVPHARLVLVGKRPAPALLALAEQGLLTLTGEVPDARPFIAGASVYVVPMRIGGGVRLKLLEALALEAPVVSTSMGAEGVAGLVAGQHCLIADQPAAFASAILRLLNDRQEAQRLGQAGRVLVRQAYDWAMIIPRLEAVYAGGRG